MESLNLLMSLATSSLVGVFGATLLERLVPVSPSYLLLLVAIARRARRPAKPALATITHYDAKATE